MRAGWPVLLAVATLTAGCQGLPEPSLRTWEPDDCDPGKVAHVNRMAPLTAAWEASAGSIAARYADLMGHSLGDPEERLAAGNRTTHEWTLLDADGRPLGRLLLRPVPLVRDGDASEWRLESEAGIPDVSASEAKELVRRLLAGFGAGDLEVSVQDEMGLMHVEANQTFAGEAMADPYGGRPHVDGLRHFSGTTLLEMRPVHDLSAARATLGADEARSIATRYWDCRTGQDVDAGRVQWTAADGALAYAVALRAGKPPFGCEGAIVVDAVTGAVLGQSIDSVCA